MKVIGKTIKGQDREYTHFKTVTLMKVIGKTIKAWRRVRNMDLGQHL
jgi:hypothetical protein